MSLSAKAVAVLVRDGTACFHLGPDGIRYAAWRALPEVTLQAMSSTSIVEETALPPMQVGVWIPEAKMGPKADNFRPLGPNTLDRVVDGTVTVT